MSVTSRTYWLLSPKQSSRCGSRWTTYGSNRRPSITHSISNANNAPVSQTDRHTDRQVYKSQCSDTVCQACKNRVMRCCCGYLSGARCRLFAYGPADATAVPKTPSSLASFKYRLVLPFWYQITEADLENRPLNRCSSSSSSLRYSLMTCRHRHPRPCNAAAGLF